MGEFVSVIEIKFSWMSQCILFLPQNLPYLVPNDAVEYFLNQVAF